MNPPSTTNNNNKNNTNANKNRRRNRKKKNPNNNNNTSNNIDDNDASTPPPMTTTSPDVIAMDVEKSPAPSVDKEIYPKFAEITNLDSRLKQNLAQMKLVTMTEIQAKTFDHAVTGTHDILGRARTGTGKTVSFLLPSIQWLLNNKTTGRSSIRMLVLSPTRELAIQIHDQAALVLKNTGMSSAVIYGGSSKNKEISNFNRTLPTILVATPGRIMDHLQTTKLNSQSFANTMTQVQIVVLDETDRLLDMGFRRDVESILKYLPSKEDRQTLLFSATIPNEVKQIMAQTMRSEYVTVDCIHDNATDASSSHTNAHVPQRHVFISSSSTLVSGPVQVLSAIIDEFKTNSTPLKMVVFFNTAHMVAFYASIFIELGINVLELHSRKSQSYRTKTANTFRAATSAILFTSDVSARGVDYPGVNYVVQLGIADSRESYIHRLGRTGRANNAGQGLLVLSDMERKFLNHHLRDLDIPVHADIQQLIDNSTPSSQQQLHTLLESVSDNNDLQKNMCAAYRSMLGFYNGKLSKMLGVSGGAEVLITYCNNFAYQAGCDPDNLPEMEPKTLRKMGISNVKNLLNVVAGSSMKNKQNNNNQRGGGGGGRGGRGNGGGRGNNFSKRPPSRNGSRSPIRSSTNTMSDESSNKRMKQEDGNTNGRGGGGNRRRRNTNGRGGGRGGGGGRN